MLIQRRDAVIVHVHNSICFEKWEVVLVPEKHEQYACLIKKNTDKNCNIDIYECWDIRMPYPEQWMIASAYVDDPSWKTIFPSSPA